MRHVQFTISDGRTMDLDVTPQLEEIIKAQCGMTAFESVTDAQIKQFFLQSLIKAGE